MASRIKYLILGNGYIGNYLEKSLKDSVIFRARVDDNKTVTALLDLHRPEVLINCIGKTGNPNVDWCEDNKFKTFYANTMLPIMIAEECEDQGVKFINIGTGCVFNSDTFLNDDATPNFFGSFYSRTKLMTEDVLIENPYTINLRIRLPISEEDSPKNFLTKAKKYKKITDIPNSITFVKDIVNAIPFVVDNNMFGNINLVHPNVTSIKEIVDVIGRTDYELASQEELQVGNRANTILNPQRLVNAGFKFVNFDRELKRCIENE